MHKSSFPSHRISFPSPDFSSFVVNELCNESTKNSALFRVLNESSYLSGGQQVRYLTLGSAHNSFLFKLGVEDCFVFVQVEASLDLFSPVIKEYKFATPDFKVFDISELIPTLRKMGLVKISNYLLFNLHRF